MNGLHFDIRYSLFDIPATTPGLVSHQPLIKTCLYPNLYSGNFFNSPRPSLLRKEARPDESVRTGVPTSW